MGISQTEPVWSLIRSWITVLIWSRRKMFQLLSTSCTYLSNFRIILLDGSPVWSWFLGFDFAQPCYYTDWFLWGKSICGCSAADARKTKTVCHISDLCCSSSFPASWGRNHQALLVMVLPGGTACCTPACCPPRFTPVLAQQPVVTCLPLLESCQGAAPEVVNEELGYKGVRQSFALCKCLYSAICAPFWRNKNALSWSGTTLSGTSVDSVSRTLWWSQPVCKEQCRPVENVFSSVF